MIFNKPKAEIIKKIDITAHSWCNEAVLFKVKNGKGTIKHIAVDDFEEYQYRSQLLINEKPVVQSKMPICQTCAGMLAAGYGIENIDCPELKAAREYMNAPYTDIMDAAENIKPLLGLLKDGIYLLADAVCYPTDGEGNFFYSVPNELRYYEASCENLYNHDFLSVMRGFPAFLFPTQSASLINDERVNEYAEIFRKSSDPPRALAYLEAGFICALLDGHHKACAAASMGKTVNCLTIIPAGGVSFLAPKRGDKDPLIKIAYFAGIAVPMSKGTRQSDIYPKGWSNSGEVPEFSVYSLTGRKFSYDVSCYPTFETLTRVMTAKNELGNITYEALAELVDDVSKDADKKLIYALAYLEFFDKDEALKLAKLIFKRCDNFSMNGRYRAALKFLVTIKTPEVEQLMIDHLVKHDDGRNNDIVDTYWQ